MSSYDMAFELPGQIGWERKSKKDRRRSPKRRHGVAKMHADPVAGGRRWAVIAEHRGHHRHGHDDDDESRGSRGTRGERGPRRHRGFGGGPGGPFGDWSFGPGGPFRGGPFGGPGRGRKRRGDVRIALLILLGEEPRNGYQLMQEITERSQGEWTPSPGSVYPALSQLEDEGLIKTAAGESGRVFEITDAGREQLAERGDKPAPWESADDGGDNPHQDIRRAIVSTVKAAAQVVQDGDDEDVAKAIELLAETRRALYRLLAGDGE
jgi:DNA-binding PadR family transcriptional regulator